MTRGGNKQRPNYWQWRRSFIVGDSNWKIFQVDYPVDMYLSLNWMLSRVWSVKHFFSKCFEQSTSWCFGSHFFVARSDRCIAICHCRFLASFFFLKEKHGKKIPLSTFHCNQLQHTRSACFKTDLPDYFRFNFVLVLTEPCGSVFLSWCHGGHVTETSCLKCHVCFHSNQYFYIPQENVCLSDDQCVC